MQTQEVVSAIRSWALNREEELPSRVRAALLDEGIVSHHRELNLLVMVAPSGETAVLEVIPEPPEGYTFRLLEVQADITEEQHTDVPTWLLNNPVQIRRL